MKNEENFNENILRIRDEDICERLNKIYKEKKDVMYSSKNGFLVDVIKCGLSFMEKEIRNVWELKNEQQTILDAIHEHTKRMNYFIKFSKPFIKNTYANCEINQMFLQRMYNNWIFKMSSDDKKIFDNYCGEIFDKMPEEFKEHKKKMFDYYDYEVDINDNKKDKKESK